MSDRRRRRARPPREDRPPRDRERRDREPSDRDGDARDGVFRDHAAAPHERDRCEREEFADPGDDRVEFEEDGAESDDAGDAVAEYERRRDALLRARREERAARERQASAEGEAERERQDAEPNPTPAPKAGAGRGAWTAAGVTAARAAVGRGFSRLTPARAVRRDGPLLWLGRRYRRFRRRLRENLTAYGHRYNSVGATAGDRKPLLLWVVDFPRLVGMWVGFAWYRVTHGATLFFRELRSRPTRIEWDKESVFSPLVGFSVPTCADLNPVWRWPAVAAFVVHFREDWRAALASTAADLRGIWTNAKNELAAEFGAVGERLGLGLAWGQTQLSRFDRLFRGSDDSAWVFACGTGVAGLALTSLLFFRWGDAEAAVGPGATLYHPRVAEDWADADPGPPAGRESTDADPVAAGGSGAREEPGFFPVAAGDSDFGDEPDFGEEPDIDDAPDDAPIAAATGGSGAEPVPPGNPFGDESYRYDLGLPELAVTLERAELPPAIPAYDPPDDDRTISVVAVEPERTRLPDDRGGWATAEPRRSRRAPVAAAARGTGPASGVSLEPGAADRFADDRVPAASGLGLTVSRTPAVADSAGGPLVYDLWVENDGDGPATAAVEERVGPGATVTAFDPPAAFTEDLAGGGTLRWDLAGLAPGELRRLTVTLAPLAGAAGPGDGAIDAAARVVGAVAVASATTVAAAGPPEDLPEPFGSEPFESGGFDGGDLPDPDPGYDDFGTPDFRPDDLARSDLDRFDDADDLPAENPPPPPPLPDAAVRPAQILTPRPDPPAPPRSERTPAAAGPRLRVTLAGPDAARRGEDVRLLVTVTNEGAAPAEAVTVSCTIPPGLTHPRGAVVRSVLGEVAPGETRTATLIARVNDAAGGDLAPTLEVTARGGLNATVSSPVRVRDGRSAALVETACR